MSLRKLKRHKKLNKKHISPDAAQKYYNLAAEHKSQGQYQEAESLLRKALHHNPHHLEALNDLGNTLYALGKTAQALTAYRTASEVLPENPRVHFNYGTTLYETGDSIAAKSALKKAIHLDPDYAEAFASLGVVYQSMGELDKSKTALDKAIQLDPKLLKAHRFLGLVYKDMGDSRAAAAKFSEILAKHPNDAFSRYLLSHYTKFSSTKEAEVEVILSQLDSPSTSTEDAIFLHFSLGKIYDDLALYQDAFHHYTLGNQKKRGTFAKPSITPGFTLQHFKNTFTPELYARFANCGNPSEMPVFIIGMPRSGTTLVEQICASHSAVYGAGELKEIGEIVQNLKPGKAKKRKKSNKVQQAADKKYPQCLTAVQTEQVSTLASGYLNFLQLNISPGILRITDKMPTNFIHVGLIRILFPKARIIHCVREPKDTCLSNFFQNFEEGNECSFNLDELVFFYQKYQELMDFWRENLPGAMYEINYEELVENSEEQSKKLIDYLDLPWEESCLSFFKTKRMVHTASDWQVSQPIYNKSVQRWKNYEEQISQIKSWAKLEKG